MISVKKIKINQFWGKSIESIENIWLYGLEFKCGWCVVGVFKIESISAFVEFVFGMCLLFNAIVFIPQAVKVYKTKDVNGLSLTTFIGFNIVQIFTMLHGVINHDLMLVYGNMLAFITCGIVTSFIIKYR